MGQKLLRKLTLKEIVGGKAEILKVAQLGCIKGKDEAGKEIILPLGEVMPLCMILGRVSGYKPGESDLGSYIKLLGAFEATNLQSGEVVTMNGACILPNFIADAIGAALQNGADSVEFAVKVNVQYKEAAATMYEYSAESLLPPTESAPITGLKAMLASQGVALPKPANMLALDAPAPEPTTAAHPPKHNTEPNRDAGKVKSKK